MKLKNHNVERIVSTDAQINKLKKQGYKEIEKETLSESTPLEKMKMTELRTLAAEKEIEGYENLRKEELIEILKDVM